MKKLALSIMLTTLVANVNAVTGDEAKQNQGSSIVAPQQVTQEQVVIAQALIDTHFDDSSQQDEGILNRIVNYLFPSPKELDDHCSIQ